MSARQRCSPLALALAGGQRQGLLLEAGSTLLVTRGALTLRFPFAWLAERSVIRAVSLRAEQTYCFADGGWVEVLASGRVEAVIVPPDAAGFWAGAAQCLVRMLAAARGREAGGGGRGLTQYGGKEAVLPAAHGALR